MSGMDARAGNLAASSAGGNIYDLGYQHYEGRRFGRFYAMWSLYVESLRGIFGFGRPLSAKAAPFILAGLYGFAAFIQLAFSSFFTSRIQAGEEVQLLTYANYFSALGVLMILFCVAQAPEVVCRDQRYQVLALYFTRAMGRMDYALARLASLVTGIFVVLFVPMVALFVGDILMKPDTIKAFGDELPKFLPSLPASAVIALALAALSLALSSFSPRRAYAAIGVLAYFLLMEAVPAAIYGIGKEAGWSWANDMILVTPVTALAGANNWFFGHVLQASDGFPEGLGADAYLAASVVSILLFTAILLLRYRRIAK